MRVCVDIGIFITLQQGRIGTRVDAGPRRVWSSATVQRVPFDFLRSLGHLQGFRMEFISNKIANACYADFDSLSRGFEANIVDRSVPLAVFFEVRWYSSDIRK